MVSFNSTMQCMSIQKIIVNHWLFEDCFIATSNWLANKMATRGEHIHDHLLHLFDAIDLAGDVSGNVLDKRNVIRVIDEDDRLAFLLDVTVSGMSVPALRISERNEVLRVCQEHNVPYMFLSLCDSPQKLSSLRVMLPNTERDWGLKGLAEGKDVLSLLFASMLSLLEKDTKVLIPFPKVSPENDLVKTGDGKIIREFQGTNSMKSIASNYIVENHGKCIYQSLRDIMLSHRDDFQIGEMSLDERLRASPYGNYKRRMREMFAKHNLAIATLFKQGPYAKKKCDSAHKFLDLIQREREDVIAGYLMGYRPFYSPRVVLSNDLLGDDEAIVRQLPRLMNIYKSDDCNDDILCTPDNEPMLYEHGDRGMKKCLVKSLGLDMQQYKKVSVRDIMLPYRNAIMIGSTTLDERLDDIDCSVNLRDKMRIIFALHNRALNIDN